MPKKNIPKINKLMAWGWLLTRFGFPIIFGEVIFLPFISPIFCGIPFIGITVSLSGFIMFVIGKRRANK
jgi:hypothetical protein